MAADQPDRAIELYMEAVALYKGEYLPECSYHEWVIPVRHRYHRIYLRAVAELIVLLKRARRYEAIIEVCEQAFTIEPLEEELHLAFLDALLASGKPRLARSHYEYITAALYRELGVKPSPAMRGLYRRMQDGLPGMELDLVAIQEELAGPQRAGGAFLCDPNVFRSLYRVERRRAERTGQAIFLALLTVAGADFGPIRPETLRRVMLELENHLISSLRRGDVFSPWNKAQFLLIMPGLNMEQAEKVLGRIKKDFTATHAPDFTLHTKLQSLPLPEGLTRN